MIRWSFLGHGLAVLALATGAHADDVPEQLPEMVVEGVRGSVLPPHFAGSATAIDAETIANSGARSVADLLVTEGGLMLSSTSGNTSDGQVQLRGFGENAASRVLVLVDGQPVNRPDMAGISWLEIPLSRIERVEILRGSQTARFGDNAVGGVINLITRSAGDQPVTTLEAAGGSDGYFLTRAGYSQRVGDQDFSFDLERNVSDGWRQNSATDLESASLRWKKTFHGRDEVKLGFGWTDEYAEFPGPLSTSRYLSDPRQSIYTLAGEGNEYFSEQTTYRGDASVLLGIGAHGRLKIPLTWSQRNQSWNFGPGSHTDNLLETVTLAPELRYDGSNWSVALGGNYRHDSLDLQQYAEIQRIHRTADASLSRELFGVFTTAEWEPWKHWHLTAAARYEHSDVDAAARSLVDPGDPALNFARSNDESNTGFQLGLRWEPVASYAAWLRYDRLYRLPSTDEIASYQGYPLTVPFNDQLHAERGHNVELGTEYKPGAWTFRVNGFAQWLEGEIAYDYLRNLNVNFSNTRRIGVEGDIAYRAQAWEAKLHAGWLDARFTDGTYAGNEVYLVPHVDATAVLACHPVKELTVQGEYQFVGSAFEGNDFQNTAEKLPSHGVANLLLRYEFEPGFSGYLRVNNLLDERYATVKYSGVWYPAAGRQFQIGIRREL
jgi:iron complex outermembrane receptor protein